MFLFDILREGNAFFCIKYLGSELFLKYRYIAILVSVAASDYTRNSKNIVLMYTGLNTMCSCIEAEMSFDIILVA